MTQVVDGPSGYSCLSEMDEKGSAGLLFEQADTQLCQAVIPEWAHAPDGAARGLGAESCKITFVKLSGLKLDDESSPSLFKHPSLTPSRENTDELQEPAAKPTLKSYSWQGLNGGNCLGADSQAQAGHTWYTNLFPWFTEGHSVSAHATCSCL